MENIGKINNNKICENLFYVDWALHNIHRQPNSWEVIIFTCITNSSRSGAVASTHNSGTSDTSQKLMTHATSHGIATVKGFMRFPQNILENKESNIVYKIRAQYYLIYKLGSVPSTILMSWFSLNILFLEVSEYSGKVRSFSRYSEFCLEMWQKILG